MSAIKFVIKNILILLVMLVITSCGPQTTNTSPIQAPSQEPTKRVTQPMHPTNTIPAPSATLVQPTQPPVLPSSTPTPEVAMEWAIQTGRLRYFAPMPDGTIYAVGDNTALEVLYAVLSSAGKVTSTTTFPIDFMDNCIRTNFLGGFTAAGINQWFFATTDGTLYTPSCTFQPGDPPSFTQGSSLNYFPFSDSPDGSLFKNRPEIPEGFQWGGNAYFWVDRTRSDRDFLTNQDTKQFGIVTRNGEVITWPAPEGLIFSNARFYITPWDVVYIHYEGQDALGNQLPSKFVRANPDGTTEEIADLPQIFKRLQNLKDPVIYLPWAKKYYVVSYQPNSTIIGLNEFDQEFNLVRQIGLTAEVSYTLMDSIFIGYDHNLYIYDNRTLWKYRLPQP